VCGRIDGITRQAASLAAGEEPHMTQNTSLSLISAIVIAVGFLVGWCAGRSNSFQPARRPWYRPAPVTAQLCQPANSAMVRTLTLSDPDPRRAILCNRLRSWMPAYRCVVGTAVAAAHWVTRCATCPAAHRRLDLPCLCATAQTILMSRNKLYSGLGASAT